MPHWVALRVHRVSLFYEPASWTGSLLAKSTSSIYNSLNQEISIHTIINAHSYPLATIRNARHLTNFNAKAKIWEGDPVKSAEQPLRYSCPDEFKCCKKIFHGSFAESYVSPKTEPFHLNARRCIIFLSLSLGQLCK
jgi:hypothetical protein